uniref:BRCA1-A complex subunit RAP80 n=1 Tax=Equus caballus TaxID=9796 RepID=A0A9L0SID3_HORSE
MPRRKKKVKEASEAQNLEKKDAETTSSVTVKRKRRLEDAFIVISDSDGEEPKEENGLQKMKTKQSNRAKCLAKRKIAQMTEEEQFALALKMSEQEAREVNSQEEEEEELLRKAIAESLNSCRPSDASATRSRPVATGPSSQSHQEKTTDSGTTEVLTRRQREAKSKSKSKSGTAAQTFLDIDKNEKCYLCKSLIPLREYQCHVESCLQLARGDQGDGPEESGRVCSTVEGKQQQQRRNPKVCVECFRKGYLTLHSSILGFPSPPYSLSSVYLEIRFMLFKIIFSFN